MVVSRGNVATGTAGLGAAVASRRHRNRDSDGHPNRYGDLHPDAHFHFPTYAYTGHSGCHRYPDVPAVAYRHVNAIPHTDADAYPDDNPKPNAWHPTCHSDARAIANGIKPPCDSLSHSAGGYRDTQARQWPSSTDTDVCQSLVGHYDARY